MENYNHYYKLFTEAPFVGTDSTELIASNTPIELTEEEACQYREDLFNSYGYLIHGWGEEDPTDDEYEDFIAECVVTFEEITKEEFEMAVEDGYDYRVV